MELNLTNCPEKYALNCKRYEVYCHECKANNKGKYLKYLPINKSIAVHPASTVQNNRDNKNNKNFNNTISFSTQGRKSEADFIKKCSYLTKTYASGSIAGDGDAYINLLGGKKIRVEIKTRFTNYKSRFVPTANELKKGLSAGVNAWIILNSVYQSTIFIDYKSFTDVFREIVLHPYILVSELYEGTHLFGFRLTKDKWLKESFFFYWQYYKVNRGIKPRNLTFWELNSEFKVIENSYGKFVLAKERTFTKLINIYLELDFFHIKNI